MEPKLVSVECNTQLDSYHRDITGETWTKFFIDLRDGEYGISQEMNDNATPEPEWNNVIQTEKLYMRPQEENARVYLESDECIALVQRVLDGGEVNWDGSNHVGSIDDDAQEAWDELVNDLNNLYPNEHTIQTCEDWFEPVTDDDLRITVNTTDDEIKVLAEKYEDEANDEDVTLTGDVEDYLIGRRTNLRDAQEED